MATDTWQEWAQDGLQRLQKRREAIEEPRWVDITGYGLRRSTKPLDAELFEKVTNSGLPKGELKLDPEREVWATQGRANATKVDSIPLNVPGKPVVLLRFNDRLWVVDGHHRVARARKEGVELPAVVYDADLQVAKHLEGEHDQQSHDPSKGKFNPKSLGLSKTFDQDNDWSRITRWKGTVDPSKIDMPLAPLIESHERELAESLDSGEDIQIPVKAQVNDGKLTGLIDGNHRWAAALARGIKSLPIEVTSIESKSSGVSKASATQKQVDRDNLAERDGIRHRTGGRWSHGESLLKRVVKHLKGQHNQKDHGLRGNRKVSHKNPAQFDAPEFLAEGLQGWLGDKGTFWDGNFRNVTVDSAFQDKLTDAYDKMASYDKDAEEAYGKFRDETNEQYNFLTDTLGIKFEKAEGDPYRNVIEAARDVEENRRLKVLPTSATGPHPYLSDEENDRFRFVHDIMGHIATGRDFDRHGEEAAFLSHASMYSPTARRALASETRGQNAFLIKRGDFPEQKVALLPAWASSQGVSKRDAIEVIKHLDKTDKDHDQSDHGKKGSGKSNGKKKSSKKGSDDKNIVQRGLNKMGFEKDGSLSGTEKAALFIGGYALLSFGANRVVMKQAEKGFDIYGGSGINAVDVGKKVDVSQLTDITADMSDEAFTGALGHNLNSLAIMSDHQASLSHTPDLVKDAMGSHPKLGQFASEVQAWSFDSGNLQDYVTSGSYGKDAGKDLFLDTLSQAPTTDVELTRGLRLPADAEWRGLTGNSGKRAFDIMAESGAEFDMPPSSFSSNPDVASNFSGFASTSGTGQPMVMKVKGNKRGLSIDPMSTIFAAEDEWVMGGRFKVLGSNLVNGVLEVDVEQAQALSTSGGVVKHMLGRHDQKTHGRRHHDMMAFSRDVLGQEVKWDSNTYYNPSGDTMMSLLSTPTPDKFKYKTSSKHPGMALLWNDDTKDSILLSRDKSGRSKMRSISTPERLLRRGQLLYGNYQQARETGEAIANEVKAVLPEDFKRALEYHAREQAAGFVARRARRKEDKAVQKSIEELLSKHLKGQHDQDTHGRRRKAAQRLGEIALQLTDPKDRAGIQEGFSLFLPSGSSGSRGWYGALDKSRELVFDAGDVLGKSRDELADELEGFVDDNWDYLEGGDKEGRRRGLGGWADKGRIYFDIPTRYRDDEVEEMARLARDADQESIFHVGTWKLLELNPDGKQRPWSDIKSDIDEWREEHDI